MCTDLTSLRAPDSMVRDFLSNAHAVQFTFLLHVHSLPITSGTLMGVRNRAVWEGTETFLELTFYWNRTARKL